MTIGITNRLGAEKFSVRILAEAKNILFPQKVNGGPLPRKTGFFPGVKMAAILNLTTHINLVSRLKINETVP